MSKKIMSAKILGLWLQAKEYIDAKYDFLSDKTEKYLEKFTELVIIDCVKLSDNQFYLKKVLRQYFGLK